jgi:hypothetical protein
MNTQAVELPVAITADWNSAPPFRKTDVSNCVLDPENTKMPMPSDAPPVDPIPARPWSLVPSPYSPAFGFTAQWYVKSPVIVRLLALL